MYLAENDRAAVAEALLRDVPLGGSGARLAPFRVVQGRRLSGIEVTWPLPLVTLHGPGLSQVGQDVWLTKCDATEYILKREWAAAIRRWAPQAAGFEWRSRRDEDLLAYILFGDREPAGSFRTRSTIPIDEGHGLVIVPSILLRYNVVLGL